MLVLIGSVVAFADGINDPKIIIHGVNGGNWTCPPQGCTNVGMNFKFDVPKKGGGLLFFTNTSGKNWTSLKLIEKGVPAIDISCKTNLFASCSTKTLKNGSVEILLSGLKGGNGRNGIPAGSSFAIQFARGGDTRWPGGLSFTAHAGVGTVPEPGTIALMLTGVGGIFWRRKVWKGGWNA